MPSGPGILMKLSPVVLQLSPVVLQLAILDVPVMYCRMTWHSSLRNQNQDHSIKGIPCLPNLKGMNPCIIVKDT
jgi:hypothetical protein